MNKIRKLEFDDQDMADFEEAFELFDKDGGGTISQSEFKSLLRCFGKKASDKDVKKIWVAHGVKDEEQEIDFEQFKQIMKTIMSEPDYDIEIIQVYKVFDPDDVGVDAIKLMQMMNKLIKLRYKHDPEKYITPDGKYEMPVITLEDAQEMIAEYDINGDGTLNFEEFAKLLME